MEDRRAGSVGPDPAKTIVVAGASGFLGRAVIRAFSEGGYEARGLVRDPGKGSAVLVEGGTPVVGDVLDVASLQRALSGATAVVHLAANPPVEDDAARVRVEGTRNLLDAARREGVRRVVIGSGYWVYGGQPTRIDEDAPVAPRGESQVNYDAEREALRKDAEDPVEVLVVRPGMVYGNGSWFRGLAESVRSGEYRVVGPGTNRWSFLDRWDAGTAFRAVVESGTPGSVYNATDGRPAPLREFVEFVAAELDAPSPPGISMEEAEREIGEVVARHLAADRPTSNERLKNLGWTPKFADYRSGIPRVLHEMFPD